jgi:hypothetical protein
MRLFIVSIFISMLVFLTQTFAQIPNGDFENWTAGNPTGWITNNISGFATPITQTSDAHSGSSAVRGEVLNVLSSPYPGFLWNIGNNGKGFPVNQRYAQLNGYYKLSPQGNDKFLVWVYLWSKDQVIAGNYGWFGAASSYTQFSVPLNYYTADTPDSASIWISVSEDTTQSSDSVNIGTVFFVDDLTFSGTATSVEDNSQPYSFKLNQNYPNPFNPTTTISYTIPKSSYVSLKVYDILGNEVSALVSGEKSAGYYRIKFDGSKLASGVYFYRLTAGNKTDVKKLLLTK